MFISLLQFKKNGQNQVKAIFKPLSIKNNQDLYSFQGKTYSIDSFVQFFKKKSKSSKSKKANFKQLLSENNEYFSCNFNGFFCKKNSLYYTLFLAKLHSLASSSVQ